MLALGLGAALAAPRLLPLGALMAWSTRAAIPFDVWHESTARLGPGALLGLVVPDALGHPARGFLLGTRLYENFQELRLYLGLPALVLAAAGALTARRHALAVVAVFALAAPTPLALALWLLPGFAGTGAARVLWLLPFLAPVLVAHGARALLRGERAPRVAAALAVALALAAAVHLGRAEPRRLGPLGSGLTPGGPPGVHLSPGAAWPAGPWLLAPTLGPLLLAAVTLGLTLLARRPGARRGAAALLVGLAAAELLREGHLYLSTSPVGAHHPDTPALRAARDAAGDGRALTRTPLMPNLLTGGGLRVVGAYGALHSARLLALLDALGERRWARQLLVPSELPAAWRDALGVRVVLDAPGAPPARDHEGLVLMRDGADLRLWAAPGALPRARLHPPEAVVEVADRAAALARIASPGFDPRRHALLETGRDGPPPAPDAPAPEPVEVLEDAPARVVLRVDAPAGGALVLADSFAPGWTCEVDRGRRLEVLPALVAVRGVLLEPGFSGVVTFRYRPPQLLAGVVVGLAALAALVALGRPLKA
ncbi:MAG: hypothetical protein M9894_05105 [Planctomycetes bacterium]|nr:hypothetical protein [Planctomycetota bacterium]